MAIKKPLVITNGKIEQLQDTDYITDSNNPKNNFTASEPPSATDDITQGYSIGSVWVYQNTVYWCTNDTEGSAVWISTYTELNSKGSLITFDTAQTELPVGSDNTVLTADSSSATGISWKSINVILTDISTGNQYKLFIDNGNLGIEEI